MDPNIPSAQNLQHPHRQFFKMDILFYNSYLSVRRLQIWKLIYFCIALLIVTIFLPIDVKVIKTDQIAIKVFMYVSIGLVTLNILQCICTLLTIFSNKEQNNQLLLRICAALDHSNNNQPIPNQDVTDIHKCVSSNMYNSSNNTFNDNEELTPEIRRKYQKIYSNVIHTQIKAQSPGTQCMKRHVRTCILAIIIYGIVILVSRNPNTAEIVVLSVFLVYLSICVYLILLGLLIMALSPFIFCVFCIYRCTRKTNLRTQSKLPIKVPATLRMIEKTEGSCSICLQNFNIKQFVIVLPCSTKHMFHSGCINNWAKFGNPTFPICRKPIQ